jgi:hypothetical protein
MSDGSVPKFNHEDLNKIFFILGLLLLAWMAFLWL